MLAHFGELQAKRAIAFAMVSHARLGQESRWSGLDPNLISMIWSLLRQAKLVGCADASQEGGVGAGDPPLFTSSSGDEDDDLPSSSSSWDEDEMGADNISISSSSHEEEEML